MIYVIPILLIILVYFIYEYNQFVKLKNKIQQAKSGIDVYLTQRFDLIPNLVQCVKGYTTHEKEIFEKITTMRNEYMKTKNLKDGETINKDCNTILALGESYPDLKADSQFLNLQKSLLKMENQLQAARRIYNSAVTTYNIKLNYFPSCIIARILKYKEEILFEKETN